MLADILDRHPRRLYINLGHKYILIRHTMGCWAIARRSDGAELFLQGDDATTLDDEYADAFNRMGDHAAVDYVCDAYDHILTAPSP